MYFSRSSRIFRSHFLLLADFIISISGKLGREGEVLNEGDDVFSLSLVSRINLVKFT